MTTYLGFRQVSAALSNDGSNPFGNGFWRATFDPKVLAVAANDFEVYHIALKGPVNSKVEVWVDRTFYDTTARGDINSWDPNEPLHMNGGSTLYFYWNSSASPTPLVTLWIRQTSPF